MHAERSGKSRAVAWILAVLAALVLYLLSVPPSILFAVGDREIVNRGMPDESIATTWLEYYGKPYGWLSETTPLKYPLRAYETWVYDLIGF